jgi:5'-phosphate synthase pdxT subunit
MKGFEEPVHGVFIRAPVVTRYGESVTPLAEVDGKIVAVQSGKILGTSFHPELTGDTRIHEYFLNL